MKENGEKSDLKIEEAMLAFQRGEIDIQSLQGTSKQGIVIKYKGELAEQ
jgi:hypothetical protein